MRTPKMKQPWKTVFQGMVLCAVVSLSANAADPVVSNLRAQQRHDTKLVDIWYDVADADGDRQTVSVSVTVDGAPIAASSFSGHVGSGVTPGSNRQIVWDAGADWNGQFSSAVCFNITADDGTTPPVPSGMVLIPGGTNAGTDPDFGAYSLTVSSFYMDRYEVTKALWDEVKNWNGGNGYMDLRVGGGKAANHPVHTVSWYDVVKWCNARSQKEGRTPVYYTDAAMTQIYKTGTVVEPFVKASANGYRLPTDSEWHYAARGGVANRRFPWGDSDTIQHARANYYSSSSYSYDTIPTRGYHPTYNTGGIPYTSPAGSFAPNGYGLYDMAGNVWEWCYDWHPSYVGSDRVVRGGGWINYADYCRFGNRLYYRPYIAHYDFGFRAVLPSGQ